MDAFMGMTLRMFNDCYHAIHSVLAKHRPKQPNPAVRRKKK